MSSFRKISLFFFFIFFVLGSFGLLGSILGSGLNDNSVFYLTLIALSIATLPLIIKKEHSRVSVVILVVIAGTGVTAISNMGSYVSSSSEKKENYTHIVEELNNAIEMGDAVYDSYELPKYEVLDIVEGMDGKTSADVLIESFSKETSGPKLKEAARNISDEIGADEINIYCSKESRKANYSDSFTEQQSSLVKDCYLGRFSY